MDTFWASKPFFEIEISVGEILPFSCCCQFLKTDCHTKNASLIKNKAIFLQLYNKYLSYVVPIYSEHELSPKCQGIKYRMNLHFDKEHFEKEMFWINIWINSHG